VLCAIMMPRAGPAAPAGAQAQHHLKCHGPGLRPGFGLHFKLKSGSGHVGFKFAKPLLSLSRAEQSDSPGRLRLAAGGPGIDCDPAAWRRPPGAGAALAAGRRSSPAVTMLLETIKLELNSELEASLASCQWPGPGCGCRNRGMIRPDSDRDPPSDPGHRRSR
jgi:hypothetical protein